MSGPTFLALLAGCLGVMTFEGLRVLRMSPARRADLMARRLVALTTGSATALVVLVWLGIIGLLKHRAYVLVHQDGEGLTAPH